MGSRIRTIQQQARELGRLRTGTYEKPERGKGHPVRSRTWILTSPAEHYVEAAATEWGGKTEKWQPQGNGAQQFRVVTDAVAIDAILPPGDPLSQSLEMWTKGGAARRCDGYTELLSDSPCRCVEDWGPEFHAIAPKDETCKMTTRLGVILPSMPDIGVWRVETHSFYSANEIAAAVDMMRAAVGPKALVPLTLRIEQRTRVSDGRTKHFPVVAVELRGATAGQVLEAAAGLKQLASTTAPARAAIGPARPDYIAQAKAAEHLEAWREVWTAAVAAGHLDDKLKLELTEIGKALTTLAPVTPNPVQTAKAEGDTEAELINVETEDENEINKAYAAVVENSPWDMSRLNTEFAQRNGGTTLNTGTVAELRTFLAWMTGGDS